jgi:hypothetical protein
MDLLFSKSKLRGNSKIEQNYDCLLLKFLFEKYATKNILRHIILFLRWNEAYIFFPFQKWMKKNCVVKRKKMFWKIVGSCEMWNLKQFK